METEEDQKLLKEYKNFPICNNIQVKCSDVYVYADCVRLFPLTKIYNNINIDRSDKLTQSYLVLYMINNCYYRLMPHVLTEVVMTMVCVKYIVLPGIASLDQSALKQGKSLKLLYNLLYRNINTYDIDIKMIYTDNECYYDLAIHYLTKSGYVITSFEAGKKNPQVIANSNWEYYLPSNEYPDEQITEQLENNPEYLALKKHFNFS